MAAASWLGHVTLASLALSFLICKVGVIMPPTSQGQETINELVVLFITPHLPLENFRWFPRMSQLSQDGGIHQVGGKNKETTRGGQGGGAHKVKALNNHACQG